MSHSDYDRYNRTTELDECLLPLKRTGAFSDLEKEALYKVFECTSFGKATCWGDVFLLGDTVSWTGTCFTNMSNTFLNLVDTENSYGADPAADKYRGVIYDKDLSNANGTVGGLVFNDNFVLSNQVAQISADWTFVLGAATYWENPAPNNTNKVRTDNLGVALIGGTTKELPFRYFSSKNPTRGGFYPEEFGVPKTGTLEYDWLTNKWLYAGTELNSGGGGGTTIFTGLTDTPANYTGQGTLLVRVKADETGLEFVAGSGGVTDFTSLTDTPANYTGNSKQVVRVNTGETDLEFVDLAISDMSDVATGAPILNQVLTWDGTNWISQASQSGGVTTLAALDDTNIVGPLNGQALTYNTAQGKWIPATISSGGGVDDVDGTLPISVAGTNNKIVSISEADGSTDGFLTKELWTFINGLTNTPECLYDTNGVQRVCATTSGATTTGTHTATSFASNSSERYKDNIDYSTEYGLSFDVMNLRPVTYTLKDSGDIEFGLIAEDVEELYPEVVTKDKDGRPTAIDYSRLVVPLIAKVKFQQGIIEEMDRTLSDVLDRLKELEQKV